MLAVAWVKRSATQDLPQATDDCTSHVSWLLFTFLSYLSRCPGCATLHPGYVFHLYIVTSCWVFKLFNIIINEYGNNLPFCFICKMT